MKTAFKYFLSIILVILMFAACSSKPENRSLSEDDITLLRSSTEMVFSKFSSLETGEVSAKIDSYEIQAKLVVSSALSWSMDISVADSGNAARIFAYKLLSADYADKTRLVSVYLGETEYKVSAEQLFGDSVIPSPAEEPEELGQEQLAILNDSVKESFSAFTLLENGLRPFEGSASSGTAAVEFFSNDSWEMTIKGTITADGTDFSLKISSTDGNSSDIDITIGEKDYSVSFSVLMEGVEIPEIKSELTEDDIAVLSGSLKNAFAAFSTLETGTQSFTYENYSGSASLQVNEDAWSIELSGTEKNSRNKFSFSLSSAEKDAEVTFNGLVFTVASSSLLGGVELPPAVMTDTDYAAAVSDLKSFGHDRALRDIRASIENVDGTGFKPSRDGYFKRIGNIEYDGTSLSLVLEVDDYYFCGSSKNNLATGTVTFTFYGSENGGEFSATDYEVSSEGLDISVSGNSAHYSFSNIRGKIAEKKMSILNMTFAAKPIPFTIQDGVPVAMEFDSGDNALWVPESGTINRNDKDGTISGFTDYIMKNPGSLL